MTSDQLPKKIESLVRLCGQLQAILSGFERVVERENNAIRRSDINELESLTEEKTAFGNAVEDKAQRIREIMEDLSGVVGLSRSGDSSLQLDEMCIYLLNWVKAEPERLDFQDSINHLTEAVNDLAKERFKIFPKLEANSYLVKKLLQYHRETYIFWQSVASDSEAVYGKTGRSLTPAKKSILSVRT
ncbi:MAG: flagellar export chaperone FlgN [Proteobacteria bacterium]|nr:flagellar export chaperone FlgN [Pseudomonadota bacterium]